MWGGQAEDTLEELVWRKGSCLDAPRRPLWMIKVWGRKGEDRVS